MMKKFSIAVICLSFSICLACQSETPLNTNTNTANSVSNLDPNNMPAGLSANAIAPSGNSTPGIPDSSAANANNLPKGATPTPGIPANPGKPVPKGATPTPGIPDPETLKKQMNEVYNSNPSNSAPSNANSQPRTTRKP